MTSSILTLNTAGLSSKQRFTQVAIHKNNLVAVKFINKSKVTLDRHALEELDEVCTNNL